jgi:16S rRNA processing protein RimM
VEDRSEAGTLLKKDVFLTEQILTELSDEALIYDLLPGYKVVDEKVGEVGEVEEVVKMPQQHLLKVYYNEEEVLIPLHEEMVQQPDHDQKTLYIDSQEGLLQS